MPGDPSDLEKVRRDLLWGMYTDVRQHSRHAETLRSNVVNFMIVVASLLIAAITADKRVVPSDLVLCLGVAVVGLLGLAFAASYTELHERNRIRAMRLRRQLDEEFLAGTANTIQELLAEADAEHGVTTLRRWGREVAGSTQYFWFILPGLVFISGVALAIVAG